MAIPVGHFEVMDLLKPKKKSPVVLFSWWKRSLKVEKIHLRIWRDGMELQSSQISKITIMNLLVNILLGGG